MKLAATTSCSVALLAVLALLGNARAEDYGAAGAARGAQVPSKLDRQIDQAVGSAGGASSSDMDARIRDLESTRTAIDQQKKPAVSLSVSGWVDQQVQYNVK
jgi:hypothetical protein